MISYEDALKQTDALAVDSFGLMARILGSGQVLNPDAETQHYESLILLAVILMMSLCSILIVFSLTLCTCTHFTELWRRPEENGRTEG